MKPRSLRRSMQPHPVNHNRRPTVLVIDDDHGLRILLKELLELKAGVRVTVAATNRKALALAEKREFDVVITDLNWSDLSGWEFLNRFCEAHPDTPVIVFSDSLTTARRRRAFRLGVFDCMAKPEWSEEIVKRVRQALEHRRILAGPMDRVPTRNLR